jgi:hypothetical protein
MKFDDVENAFFFVSSASQFSNSALLCKETGEIFYISEMGDSDDLPEDIEDSEKYIEIPHKNDLDLGKSLVIDFISETCPELLGQAHDIFRRKGAYSRFKVLLDSKGLLDDWYKYEDRRTKEELCTWCAENGIELNE